MRPDGDNMLKLLKDALRKFVYADDSQVTDCRFRKRFAAAGDPPRIELVMEEDADADEV